MESSESINTSLNSRDNESQLKDEDFRPKALFVAK